MILVIADGDAHAKPRSRDAFEDFSVTTQKFDDHGPIRSMDRHAEIEP